MEITEGVEVSHQIKSTFTTTIRIKNFKKFTETQEELRFKETEIFPGKKIAIVVKNLPEKSPDGKKYDRYNTVANFDSKVIHCDDKFFFSGAAGWREC